MTSGLGGKLTENEAGWQGALPACVLCCLSPLGAALWPLVTAVSELLPAAEFPAPGRASLCRSEPARPPKGPAFPLCRLSSWIHVLPSLFPHQWPRSSDRSFRLCLWPCLTSPPFTQAFIITDVPPRAAGRLGPWRLILSSLLNLRRLLAAA